MPRLRHLVSTMESVRTVHRIVSPDALDAFVAGL